MDGAVFLSYWLFGLRRPTLELAGSWVEPGLGAEMRTSGRPHSDKYSLESEVLNPAVWTQCSHHWSSDLTPGLGTKIPQAA